MGRHHDLGAGSVERPDDHLDLPGRGWIEARGRLVEKQHFGVQRPGTRQREALKLHVISGLTYPEVARKLACTEDNARQRVSRGLRRLAIVLQERGLRPAAEVETP